MRFPSRSLSDFDIEATGLLSSVACSVSCYCSDIGLRHQRRGSDQAGRRGSNCLCGTPFGHQAGSHPGYWKLEISWLALDTALALAVWISLCALHTLAKALVAQPCVERKVLPLHINGRLVDAWPDSAGVNAMSRTAADTFNLKVDTEKVRYIRTGLGDFHLTCGEVKANVAFAGYSRTQEVTFDVLTYWIRGLPEVTVGERFLDENGLFNTQDHRYATRPCTLCLCLVLLMATATRQRLRFLPVLVNLPDAGKKWMLYWIAGLPGTECR